MHAQRSTARGHGPRLGAGLVVVALALARPVAAQPMAADAPAAPPDAAPPPPARAGRAGLHTGVIGVVRIDGELRGAAAGLGLAIGWRRLELDVLVLRSEQTGGYLGARYRFGAGLVRPYAALGVPGFVYDQMDAAGDTATRLALGVRAAAGVELRVHAHLSVQADLGYEHFFGVGDSRFEADVFVPAVGVIGRL